MTISLPRYFLAPDLGLDGVTRRRLLGGGLATAAALLVGCGSNSNSNSNSNSQESPVAERTTTTVAGDFGTVEVPVNPTRVVTTYTDTLDLAVALGLPVVGGPGARGDAKNPFPPFLDQQVLANAERISTYPEVKVEQIAALKPDLILDSYGDKDLYAKLSKVAPTISIAPFEKKLTWQEVLGRIAAPLNRSDKATAVIQARATRASEVREAIAAGPYAGAVVAAGYGQADKFGLYGADISPCPMLLELGMTLLPDAPKKGAKDYSTDLSLELLDKLEPAKAIFVTGDPPEGGFEPDQKAQTGLRSAPLWTSLPAAKSGSVFDFPVDLAFSGPGSDAALLDLLEKALAG